MDPLRAPLDELLAAAREVRGVDGGRLVTYSPKVFIPLTKLCRDVCHYCTFARPPRRGERAYMTIDEVLAVARAGERAGCREALFTLGDKPELRYRAARDELAELGYSTTIEYLAAAARAVLEETSLLPHLNPGVLTAGDFARLLDAGIDDWGGVSPVTIDHVNPEAPWPDLERLRAATESRGLELAPRLTVYPRFVDSDWIAPSVLPQVLRASDSLGLAR